HPSEEAVEYIWEIFKETYVDAKGLQRLKEGESIRKGLEHRPLPNVTRVMSQAAIEREETRIAALEERKKIFLMK
ncbi:MAG: GSCFA domain-containing protein, partial [Muribaculaceae bacterium]|nr:GSCFA domain-containing protein [Muribaculaceae bacterium]